jgi:hypothetical protein
MPLQVLIDPAFFAAVDAHLDGCLAATPTTPGPPLSSPSA